MIILDTETTNLTVPEAAPISQQPYITEFAAIRLDDKTLKETARMDFLCSIPVSIPVEAVKITGITDAMLRGKPPFVSHLAELQDLFLGEKIMVAHNLAFDRAILKYELMRLDKLLNFPWPPVHVCTVEATTQIKGFRLNLSALHELATGKPHPEAHRAMADVQALATCVRWLKKKGLIL